jgi:hypothetical protein
MDWLEGMNQGQAGLDRHRLEHPRRIKLRKLFCSSILHRDQRLKSIETHH